MSNSINIETLSRILRKSRWISHEKRTCIEFKNDKILLLNNTITLRYFLICSDGKINIQIDKTTYTLDYINDLILRLYNNNEDFVITPE